MRYGLNVCADIKGNKKINPADIGPADIGAIFIVLTQK